MFRLVLAGAAFASGAISVAAAGGAEGEAAGQGVARGGRVGWARLIVKGIYWDRHTDQDPKLAAFIRSQTTLNIDPTWYTADPGDLEQLCRYPFIYVKELERLQTPAHLENLREYLDRGGFIFVDPCTNGFSPGQKDAFQARHAAYFKRLFPTCEVRKLADDHEIYRCYFEVTVHDLFTPDMLARGAIKPEHIGFDGVFLGDRLIAVVSVSGLECGWPETPQRMPGCMRIIVNSYIHTMTR